MILRKTLQETVWKSVACTALLGFHLVLAVLFFHDFQQEADSLKRLVPFDIVKKMVDVMASKGLDGYLMVQHFAKAVNTFGTFAAVFFAAFAVAGEVDRKTIELTLSRPISRRRILATKYLVGAAGLLLPLAIVTPLAIPLAAYIEEPVSGYALFLETIHSSLFLLLLYSLTFLFSTWMSDPAHVAFWVLGIALIEFALLVVKQASNWSIYKLAEMTVMLPIVTQHRLPWALDLGLLAGSAVLFGAALWKFERRDF